MNQKLVVVHGDALEVLSTYSENTFDSIVTDPPYGLAFMGKAWDAHPTNADFQTWCEQWAVQCLRVLKPGGHMLAFGGSRTYHRMACAVEDAGFEIRDTIQWLYGSGFPKSKNVALAIDKGEGHNNRGRAIPTASTYQASDTEEQNKLTSNKVDPYLARSTAGQGWEGWGTALKPAYEPIIMARKPLEGTVAVNVLAHGTGAINIDASRISTGDKLGGGHSSSGQQMDQGWKRPWMDDPEAVAANAQRSRDSVAKSEALGRWPANVILSHSEGCVEVGTRECAEGCPVAELDSQSGDRKAGASISKDVPTQDALGGEVFGTGLNRQEYQSYADSGGASRFFYTAKAAKKERPVAPDGTKHPTVKPLALMRYLIRMVTPPGGMTLDPFAGSGTTGEAAALEGFSCVLIEKEQSYVPLIKQRLDRTSYGRRQRARKNRIKKSKETA